MKLRDRLTLVIYSCGRFSDLWDAHVTLLEKNWGDRGIRTIILTDAPTDKSYAGIEIISAGKDKELTERIRHLLPLLETEYVLVTLDDYFLTTPISTDAIARLVDIMDESGLDYIRMFDRPKCQEILTQYKGIYTFSLDRPYRVNLYSGIWRKRFVQDTLPSEELNAWEYEVVLTEYSNKARGKCAMSKGREFPILDVVRKGRILPKAWHYLNQNDLYQGSRRKMPISSYIGLWVKTQVNRLLAMLPRSMYRHVKRFCVSLGMNSFSAKK